MTTGVQPTLRISYLGRAGSLRLSSLNTLAAKQT